MVPDGVLVGGGAGRSLLSRGHDVGEGDHVLRVMTGLLLPADGVAGLWRPLLHTQLTHS